MNLNQSGLSGKWRLLVVDDNEEVYQVYQLMLGLSPFTDEIGELESLVLEEAAPSEESPFSSTFVSSGEAGYSAVKESLKQSDPYAVVLLDMRMPGGWDGLETAKMIRTVDQEIRIIFVTAYMDYQLSDLRRKIGANFDFIRKPLDQDQLQQLVISQVNSWQRFHDLPVAPADDSVQGDLLELVQQSQSELEHFSYAVDQHVVISQTDMAGRITHVNDKFCEMSGYSRDELIGQNHKILKSGFHNGEFYRAMWKTISSGAVWHGSLKNLNKSGEVFWTHATIVPIRDEQGELVRYMAIRTDISGLKRIEQQLIEAIDSVEVAAESKDSFIASMSHELRTPLTSIIGNSELLLNSAASNEQQELLHAIEIAGRTQLALVNDLLDMSKVESGKFSIEEAPYNLYKLLDDVQHIFTLKMRDAGLKFSTSVLVRPENKLLGDAQRISQVLINLLGNAMKFTPKGSITLKVTEQDGLLCFSIKDTGVGISQELLPKLFERFVQGDHRSTARFRGTGLGLYISYTLAQSMKGSLSVSSVEGEGAEFIFSIPYLESSEALQISERNKAQSYQCFKGHVLFVEDLPELRKRQSKLSELMGLTSSFSNSGEEACTVVTEESFDLIFMDLTLPGMSGEEVMLWMRSKGIEAPIIALVTQQQVSTIDTFLSNGGSDYLIKPLIIEEFQLLLEQFLPMRSLSGEEEPSSQAVMFSGNLLVAEDVIDLQKLERRLFESFGLTVTFANNGEEAVELATTGQYDLLFMDMQMPVMDGIQATELLRSRGYSGPIIALTANVMQKHQDQFDQAGCDGLLKKPIDREELVNCLSHYLSSVEPSSSEGIKQQEIKQQEIDSAIPAELVEEFFQTIKEYRNDLSLAFEQKQWTQVYRTAHNIKGCGGAFGFPALTDLAAIVCENVDQKREETAVPYIEQLIADIDSICP